MLKKIGKMIKYMLTLGILVGSSSYNSIYTINIKKYDAKLEKKLLMDRKKHNTDENKVKEINNAIVVNSIRYAIKIAHKYKSKYHTYEQIESTAIYGLIKAVERFDPEISQNFKAYKATCITNEILGMFKKDNRCYGEEKSIEEINEENSSKLNRLNRKVNGFDGYYTDEKLQCNNITEYFEKENNKDLKTVLIGLSYFYLRPKYKDIFFMKYLNDINITQKYIAKVTNSQQSYVSRILKSSNLSVYEGYKELEEKDINSKNRLWNLYHEKGEEIIDLYIQYDDCVEVNNEDIKDIDDLEV